MIDIKIDPQSAVPPFEQLREAVIARIASGELAPGSKLPPVRSLAAELGLAANTVARSYKELEAAGFVQTQGRNGTIVAPSLDDADRHRRALQLTSEYLMTMTAIGVRNSWLAWSSRLRSRSMNWPTRSRCTLLAWAMTWISSRR